MRPLPSGTPHPRLCIHPRVKRRYIPNLTELMRSALRRVEQSEGSEDKASALSSLRSNVVRTIAEHELRTAESAPIVADVSTEDTAA